MNSSLREIPSRPPARPTLGRRRRVAALCLGLPVAAAIGLRPSQAGPPPEDDALRVTRREAVEIALAYNTSVAAAQEQVEEARARVVEATAFPDLAFSATAEAHPELLHPGAAASRDIGLAMTIPFPGKLHLSGNVARADLRSAELSLSQLRQQLESQTVQAYDALLVAIRHGVTADEGKRLAQDFLQKTEARYQAGSVPKLDIVKAKVDFAQAENESIAVARTIATARAALNRLLGRPLGAAIEPSGCLDVPPSPPDLEALESLAHVSRPELLSIASSREGARAASTLASRYWQPDLGLTLYRNYTVGLPPGYSTAATFTLPLLFWQHQSGQVAEAHHREAELAATASDLAAQVSLDVRTAYAAATTARRQAVYIRDELLPEAREAYRIASVTYGLGGSSALELLDAKRTMLEAEDQYADALGAANDARADLERAVGAPLDAPAGGTDEK